jgi:hypothetical protein
MHFSDNSYQNSNWQTNLVRLTGQIIFDPEDRTNKHSKQSSWKKVAMVLIGGDVCEYYGWFLKKRFNLKLHKPIRGAHVTFINDRASDMNDDWELVKQKWYGKEIEIVIELTPKTDSSEPKSDYHWWFNIPNEHKDTLQSIREELGLGKPFFELHMTIGRAVDFTDDIFEPGVMKAKEMCIDHSKYIHRLYKNGYIR